MPGTRRIQSGQALPQMVDATSTRLSSTALKLFADWTDRVAAGELPFDEAGASAGIERNLVLTQMGLVHAHRLYA